MSAKKSAERPSLEYLRKMAKARLAQLRRSDAGAKLAQAQLEVARENGFASWRALVAELQAAQPIVIKSPVARTLRAVDPERSMAFYRDVLGFNVLGEAECALGPVRLELSRDGETMLFLQVSDVTAAHKIVRARGGAPGNVEKVNWIKMQMFEMRDPAGNVLWFGQSYHVDQDSPSRRGEQPKGFWQALPELPFDDVAAAVEYYREVLGFSINYQQDDLGVMDRDAISVLLIQRTKQHKGIGSFEVYTADVDALYRELTAKGAKVDGPPVSHPWGLRDFRVTDPEGNRITFAQTFE